MPGTLNKFCVLLILAAFATASAQEINPPPPNADFVKAFLESHACNGAILHTSVFGNEETMVGFKGMEEFS